MNEDDVLQAIERVMARVDYYLHCELDVEYAREEPDIARRQLEAGIRTELLRVRAIGLVSATVTPTRTS
ncbi:MAG: hypothetical protein EOP81_16515 [Variovorax sp.]|nr:MAG: hypothetical protein EOP81_16515 [Variovorax sp.]